MPGVDVPKDTGQHGEGVVRRHIRDRLVEGSHRRDEGQRIVLCVALDVVEGDQAIDVVTSRFARQQLGCWRFDHGPGFLEVGERRLPQLKQ